MGREALIVQTVVQRFLLARAEAVALSGALDDQTLIFDAGLLDSVSLLELVAAVEQASGQTLDMIRFDPSAVNTLPELVAELSAALVTS